MSLEQIKDFLNAFNSEIKEKLTNPSYEEMFPETIQRIKKACQRTGKTDNSLDEYLPPIESYEVKFNF